MLYAVDLLHDYPGWTPAERKAFEKWWRRKCLIHTREVIRKAENNWLDAGILGVLAAAVAFEDKALLNEGHRTLKKYFLGSWKIRQDHRETHLPHEVVRGYRGVIYTAYAFTTMVQSLEILRYAGYNYWHKPTTKGATLKAAIECFFNWNVLKEPFPWYKNPATIDERSNTFEIANNHFDIPKFENGSRKIAQ